MVKRCLIELKEIYPIDYAVVLAYFPSSKYASLCSFFFGTILLN